MRTWLAALAVAVGAVLVPTASSAWPGANAFSCAQAVVTKWTLPRLAAETIVVPVETAAVPTMGAAAAAGFGGIILFGSSAPTNFAAQLAAVQAQSASGYPLLVMTDEEGGGVWRLANLVPSIPWAQTMGKTMSAARITATATTLGRELSRLGVNVDLAPVVDVDGRAVSPGASNPDGYRSFSGSPWVAAADGVAFAHGLAAGGVTAVVKHFPGLGGSSRNTDYGPARTRPWSVLQSTGLVPFRAAIAAGVPAIMMSNASVPGLTALPASLSSAPVNYLRSTMGFTGLIVTDSLSAGAISAQHLSVQNAAVESLSAGDDLFLFSPPSPPATPLFLAQRVRATIVAAVVHGAILRTTLVDAAAHVLATRANVCATPTTTAP